MSKINKVCTVRLTPSELALIKLLRSLEDSDIKHICEVLWRHKSNKEDEIRRAKDNPILTLYVKDFERHRDILGNFSEHIRVVRS